jgi:hypothetical protein
LQVSAQQVIGAHAFGLKHVTMQSPPEHEIAWSHALFAPHPMTDSAALVVIGPVQASSTRQLTWQRSPLHAIGPHAPATVQSTVQLVAHWTSGHAPWSEQTT